jgi:hypothetical protein
VTLPLAMSNGWRWRCARTLLVLVSASLFTSQLRSTTTNASITRRKRGPDRKLVDDAKVIASLKKAGKTGIAAGALGSQFQLSGAQMSAVLQRLAGEKKVKSNGVRGRGGRWKAL